jgi:hypothetical protein
MEERLVLTRVKVPPDALVGVIVTGQLLLALGTRPARVVMLSPQIDALAGRVQRDAADAPWRLNAQNRFEQLRVLQPTTSSPSVLSHAGWRASKRQLADHTSD